MNPDQRLTTALTPQGETGFSRLIDTSFFLFLLLSCTQRYYIDLHLTRFLIKQGVQLVPTGVKPLSHKNARCSAAHQLISPLEDSTWFFHVLMVA